MKWKKLAYTRPGRIFINGLFKDNPVTCMVLGICSVLAITNRLDNTLAMSAGVLFVLLATSLLVAWLRSLIPARLRILTFMLIIASFTICVDLFLKAFFPVISHTLGPYVGLIITNCIILGRAEAFASKNKARYAFLDALAVGLGYAYVLIIIALIRELLAYGTFFNYPVLPDFFPRMDVLGMAPGAFFVLALVIWGYRTLSLKRRQRNS